MTGVRAARGGWVVALAVALAGCSASPAKQDKQNVQKARSILAEWAMLAESRQAGRLTGIYYRQMRETADTELTALASAAPQSGTAAGQAIAEAADMHGEPPLALLRARVAAAERIENGLEAD